MATQAPSRIGLACPKCRRALYPIGDMEPDICVYCGTDLHGLATEPAPAAPVVPDGPVPHTAGPQAPE
ncbi:MAG: hypothetical protein MUE77_09885, partial [Sandarakinorhabdus sp.]|nr:hypothetical protein [Sandarakinorhabdus sp.]